MKRLLSLAFLSAALLGLGTGSSARANSFLPLMNKGTAPSAPAVKRALLVLAHPDDETMMGGTLARFKELGIEVHAVYANHGEGGKRVVVRKGKPVEETPPSRDWLKRTRGGELARAAKHYGIKSVVVVGVPDAPTRFADGGPAETGAQFLARGDWDQGQLERAIGRAASTFDPDVVITMLADNPKVHPHHQAIGQIARRLFLAGKLGKVQQVYGIEESAWYPPETFKTSALGEASKVRFDTARPTRRSGPTYAQGAARGAALHKSQLTGHLGEVHQPEVFVPLTPGPSPLATVLATHAPPKARPRAMGLERPQRKVGLPRTFKPARPPGRMR